MKSEIIFVNIPALLKVFIITSFSFIVAMAITPILTYFLYKYKIRQQIKELAAFGGKAPIYQALHYKKANTPTMGGLLIWFTVLFVTFLIYYLGKYLPLPFIKNLNFLSRSQTWIPLFSLVAAGLLGAFDDLYGVYGKSLERGLKVRWKFFWQGLIAVVGAWWFYYKWEYTSIHIPAWGPLELGFLYIPLFILVIISTANAVNITDGLDGLSGGVLATSFGAFGAIALAAGKVDLAALCGAILGALLAFLWFNIYPARFFMGDTGSLALGATLGVVAMTLNAIVVLPIIGFVLVAETLSVILQFFSKKLRGKKIFLSSPLHHHFEAKGWPEPKIVMRFWIISAVMAVIGLIIGLLGRG